MGTTSPKGRERWEMQPQMVHVAVDHYHETKVEGCEVWVVVDNAPVHPDFDRIDSIHQYHDSAVDRIDELIADNPPRGEWLVM